MDYTEAQIRDFKILSITFNKTIIMDLIGLDGNAFALMAAFQKNAKRQGWEKEEIDYVLWQCTQGDYDHLLQTLLKHTETDSDNPDTVEINGRTYRAVD